METEKSFKPTSGFGMLFLDFALLGGAIASFILAGNQPDQVLFIISGMMGILLFTFISIGFFLVNPKKYLNLP